MPKKKNANLAPRLQNELKVCRQTARQQRKVVLRFIAERKFFLAVTTLIETEVAESEAEVLARAAGQSREAVLELQRIDPERLREVDRAKLDDLRRKIPQP